MGSDPKTLGEVRALVAVTFGDDSPAVTFLDRKIAVQGADAAIIADSSQLLHALWTIHQDGTP